jgi:hypothetical protein
MKAHIRKLLILGPGDFLVVDDPALAIQLFGCLTISLAGIFQENLLHTSYQLLIGELFL